MKAVYQQAAEYFATDDAITGAARCRAGLTSIGESASLHSGGTADEKKLDEIPYNPAEQPHVGCERSHRRFWQ